METLTFVAYIIFNLVQAYFLCMLALVLLVSGFIGLLALAVYLVLYKFIPGLTNEKD